MIVLDGSPGPGVHQASNYLRRQIPLIAETYPAIRHCHSGTINVLFDVGLILVRPDHRTPALDWGPGGTPEVFDLAEVEFEAPTGSSAIQGWLYVPHHSPHRQTPQLHEVILARRLDLRGVTRYRLHLDRQAVTLPYLSLPLILGI